MPNSEEIYNSQIEGVSEEEMEYEEVEVEEEIEEQEEEEEVEYEDVEVEEEIEEEMEKEKEEIEEEEEAIEEEEEEAEEMINDSSEGLESDGYALIKSTPEESESILASADKEVTNLTNNKEALYTSVPNVLDKHASLKESRCSETSNEKEYVDNQTPDENVQQVKKLSPQEVINESSNERNMMEVDFTLEKEGKILLASNFSSMLAPQKRPRSATPVNELENSSKKAAIICDFYARGWCIKGISCPFLHQKERNKKSIAESSRKENVSDGSGSYGESKSMSLSSQEKPYSSKPLLQTVHNEHMSNHDQIPERELYNALPLLKKYSHSPPVRNSIVNDRCHFNGFDKGYQSSGSSSLPKSPSSFLSKFTSIPSSFPARLRRKIELEEEYLWETSKPFVPTYPSIIARLYPHKKQHDSLNVLTRTNVLNGSTKKESYGQSSGAKPLLPKEEKHASTNNNIDVASANNDNGLASANIVGGLAQGQGGGNLKHGGGDMEVESKESKEMKAFRVALIEFVKELVKPFWHEGRLSKDAHKKVVKKSVEKVICSFEAYQIPSESESINQYLSTNRPKLVKLVEAYVGKYSIA